VRIFYQSSKTEPPHPGIDVSGRGGETECGVIDETDWLLNRAGLENAGEVR